MDINLNNSNQIQEHYDLSLKHPSRFIIFGVSGSGKTTFLRKMLIYMKELFGFLFDRIIYFSGQGFIDDDEIHGIPNEKISIINKDFIEQINPKSKNLLILDDNMHQITNDMVFSDIFTKYSHHLNMSVIFIVQNLFPKSKFMPEIRSNNNYFIFMSNPGDKQQIKNISRRIDGTTFISDVFQNVTNNNPFSYLFVDLHQETPDEIRVRTNVFPNEETFVFVKVPKI